LRTGRPPHGDIILDRADLPQRALDVEGIKLRGLDAVGQQRQFQHALGERGERARSLEPFHIPEIGPILRPLRENVAPPCQQYGIIVRRHPVAIIGSLRQAIDVNQLEVERFKKAQA
jgi:hypothetical protein